jgi:hypothetical protein
LQAKLKTIPFLLILSSVAFLFHFIWENSHISLYTNYEKMEIGIPVPLLATFGDVFYTLMAFFVVSLFKRSMLWINNFSVRVAGQLSLIGALIALFVEYKAMYFAKWAYSDLMPVIPYLSVGISPIVQMALLLPLSVFLAQAVEGKLMQKK